MPRTDAKKTGAWIRRLEKIRNRYGGGAGAEKRAILEALALRAIDDARLLLRYHEALLFLRAYPDDERIFRLARRECARIGARVARLHPSEAELLDDTAVAGTPLHYTYDLVTAGKLLHWFGDTLDIDWDEMETTEGIDQVLPLAAEWVENDGLDLADISTFDWIALRKGAPDASALRWLVASIERIDAAPAVKRRLYDAIELPVVWDLGDCDASRTNHRVSNGPVVYHDGPLLRRVADFRKAIIAPGPELEAAPRREASRLIRSARCSLAVRHRSLYPIEYANPDDVLVFEPGRGYRLVLYGMQPPYRLPWESDYGALIVKNGYPIGYGVGAMLFEQMEIAVNIFDTWRGGEAAHVFTQFIRAFHRHFGCTRFKIVNYQVGHENEEGLKSGSFWFYYKLGFVPKDGGVRRLAAAEFARIHRDGAYRTPVATLKKLAVSDMYLTLRGDPAVIPEDFPLADLGTSTTAWIGDRFDGDGRRAKRECAAAVARALGSPGWKRWPRMEREWFARLAIPLARIDGLERWPREDRRALVALLRSKGKPGEAEYVRRLLGARRLRRSLTKIAKGRGGRERTR